MVRCPGSSTFSALQNSAGAAMRTVPMARLVALASAMVLAAGKGMQDTQEYKDCAQDPSTCTELCARSLHYLATASAAGGGIIAIRDPHGSQNACLRPGRLTRLAHRVRAASLLALLAAQLSELHGPYRGNHPDRGRRVLRPHSIVKRRAASKEPRRCPTCNSRECRSRTKGFVWLDMPQALAEPPPFATTLASSSHP